MRTIRYYIINKNTMESVKFCKSHTEAEQYLANMADKENYGIGYKWFSL
jgi:hypothetical protein